MTRHGRDPPGHQVRVPHESWAGRPTWTPDGQALVYLSYPRDATSGEPNRGSAPAQIRRIGLDGTQLEALTPFRRFRSVFYLPDGRLAWTVLERKDQDSTGRGRPDVITRFEVMSGEGEVSTFKRLEGLVDRVVASAGGDGLYVRRLIPLTIFHFASQDDIVFLPLSDEGERHIVAVSGMWWDLPRFALSPDGAALYVADAGQLLRFALPDGFRERVPFRARIRVEVREPTPPLRWPAPIAGTSAPPRVAYTARWTPWLPEAMETSIRA